MAERLDRDEYSSDAYPDDESINVGTVCSWSINDIPKHRSVVNVVVGNFRFNSNSQSISDENLLRLADRLQQAEAGDATSRIGRARRAFRASLRDYDQEAQWAAMTSRPPRRPGEVFVREKIPGEKSTFMARRQMADAH
jgi:hypothetical protein